jgi:hypothetical protein
MIHYSKLNRIQKAVRKCQAGSAIHPVTEQMKQKYAKEHNLSYNNGQFFLLDASGNPTTSIKEVSDNELRSYQGGIRNAGTLNNINQGIDIVNAALLRSNPRINNQATETQMANTAYDMASEAVGKVNPMVGTIMKAGGFASDALTAAGIDTDQESTLDKALDSKFLKLTPVGLVNSIGASKTQDFALDTGTVEKVGGSYGGTVAGIYDASQKAGKKYGLFSGSSKRKANAFIGDMRRKQNVMADIAKDSTDQREMVDMMGSVASQAYSSKIAGGHDVRHFRAKEGGKFADDCVELEHVDLVTEKIMPSSFAEGGLIDEIINASTGKIEEWVPEIVDVLEDGGKIEKQLDAPEIKETDQKNVIPEGALHKNKHGMDNAGNLTKKGIPVVDDDHAQQAEIERNEIIFTKEVTEKLEELYKVYYDESSTQRERENAAIDAGKLLTKEIMLNTDDRTGLIDTLKQGGSLMQSANLG